MEEMERIRKQLEESHAKAKQQIEQMMKQRTEDEERLKELKQSLENIDREQHDEQTRIKERIAAIENDWPMPRGLDTQIVNVAVMGQAGAGKSSVVNKILGKPVAPTGVTQVSKLPVPYDWQVGSRVGKLWDLPGAGTKGFDVDVYVKRMGLRYYDSVLIVTDDRWKEVDAHIFASARKFGISCCIVRNKMDQAIENNEVDHQSSADTTMKEVIGFLRSELDKVNPGNVESDRVFLISCRDKFGDVLNPQYVQLLAKMSEDLANAQSNKANKPHSRL